MSVAAAAAVRYVAYPAMFARPGYGSLAPLVLGVTLYGVVSTGESRHFAGCSPTSTAGWLAGLKHSALQLRIWAACRSTVWRALSYHDSLSGHRRLALRVSVTVSLAILSGNNPSGSVRHLVPLGGCCIDRL